MHFCRRIRFVADERTRTEAAVSSSMPVAAAITITSGIHRRTRIFAESIEKEATLLTSQLAKRMCPGLTYQCFGQKILYRVIQLPVYLAKDTRVCPGSMIASLQDIQNVLIDYVLPDPRRNLSSCFLGII
jgi:hypothetical protein